MNTMNVKAWTELINIPTYEVGAPDKNPMFFEKRIYQGSSGVVYPHPVIEKIFDEKVDRLYTAVFLENKYLKIMVLPELGGRVQMAYDKIKQRHFIYYNQVIKPALVGLCGPWISGGIEFNWPQHHRPSTYDPIDYSIEENADGSQTIWVNEVEKMFRTKGMAGFTLHPNKAYLEIKAKLYNRTNLPQTFLWWANPAVAVNDDYQSVFPPDVNAVFDHGKRDVSTFPIATGTYYKVDYSPGTDISRYKNIKVPTSYMAGESDYDFVGGYEHDTRAGVIHVADHHISPGKKQWTWGCGDFGIAWDRNLTDEDGPYIELMTGVFTDNQPDFSWLMPYEEKSFTQYFLPYRELGMVKNATKDILLSTDIKDKQVTVKLFATSERRDLRLTVSVKEETLTSQNIALSPEMIFDEAYLCQYPILENDLLIIVSDSSGFEMLRYEPRTNRINDIPEPAKPARSPKDITNNEQLFLTGQHLEQYRHATYSPVPYYEEALARDEGDVRNNNALGLWYFRRGQFALSEKYFKKAIETVTQRNPNPYDSEPYYNLGLSLKYQNRHNSAYDAFYKAAWSSAWQDAAYFTITQIDILRGNFELALEHIDWSIDRNARNGKAYVLKALTLRKLNRLEEALSICKIAIERDLFNIGILFEQYYCYLLQEKNGAATEVHQHLKTISRGSANTLMEYAIDYAAAGQYQQAIELLLLTSEEEQSTPMVNYYLGYYWHYIDAKIAEGFLEKGRTADPAYCFPNKLEDIIVLQHAMTAYPSDARAAYYLGNLWYDKRQYAEAIAAWESSLTLDPAFATVYRNLAIAYYNKKGDVDKAHKYFEKAFSLDVTDGRVLMELDQLCKRMNISPESRLNFLEINYKTAILRDDLFLEIISLNNFQGNFEKAFHSIAGRKFHPWEGGEGKVSSQYIYSLVEMAKKFIAYGEYQAAVDNLLKARNYPGNLGEGKLYGAQENDIFYWLGRAFDGLHDNEQAVNYYQLASSGLSEPSAALFYNDQQPDKIFYQGMAKQRLGEKAQAQETFKRLVSYGAEHMEDEIKIDYFAVSLPDLMIFEDDLNKRNKIHCWYLQGLGYAGLGKLKEAKIAFQNVLDMDAMHFGAKTHIGLLDMANLNIQEDTKL
jgi:tetratricopeptide (TPR) repeat protein